MVSLKTGALFLLCIIVLYVSHGNNGRSLNTTVISPPNPNGTNLVTRFSPPAGHKRQAYAANSFAYFLSRFPLKPLDAKVYYYDGGVKPNDHIYASVFDIDIGNKNLQQCADAIMRLRAEYFFKQKRFDRIHFNFTSGFRADYTKWAKGYRIKVAGNKVTWYKAKEQDYSYSTFRQYLDIVFTYAGTLSLNKELKPVPHQQIEIGDVFIIGGSPGHAVIVVDMAVRESDGQRVFMIAQSFMPAQSIHLLVNRNDESISPWYSLADTDGLYSPEYSFSKSDLKRFPEE